MIYAIDKFNEQINEISILKLGKLSLPVLNIGTRKRRGNNEMKGLIFQTIRDAGEEGITMSEIMEKNKISYSGVHKNLSILKNMRIGIMSRTIPGHGRELKYRYDKPTNINVNIPDFMKDILAKDITMSVKHEDKKGEGVVDEETGKPVEEWIMRCPKCRGCMQDIVINKKIMRRCCNHCGYKIKGNGGIK